MDLLSLDQRRWSKSSLKNSQVVRLVTVMWLILLLVSISSVGWSQSTDESDPIVTQPPVLFQTEPVDGNIQLGFFNLLHFYASPEEWHEAEVELKFSLGEDEVAQLKLVKQMQAQARGETQRKLVRQISLPPLDYDVVGKLYPVSELVKPVWVIWLPTPSSSLSKQQQKSLKQTLQTLIDLGTPEAELYLYLGISFPILNQHITRLADLDLDQVSLLKSLRLSKKQQGSERLNPTSSGLAELITVVRNRHRLDLEERYTCGKPCAEFIPHVRFIVLEEEGGGLLKIPHNEHVKARLQSIRSPNHLLFRSQLFSLIMTPEEEAPQLPSWWSWFNHDEQLDAPQRGNLDALKLLVSIMKRYEQRHYYTVPLFTIPSYFWGRDRIDISLRISKGEQAHIRRGELLMPPQQDNRIPILRSQVVDQQRRRIDAVLSTMGNSSQLSLTTRILITMLWIGLCCAVLTFIVMTLKRSQQTSKTSHSIKNHEVVKASPWLETGIEDVPIASSHLDGSIEHQIRTPEDRERAKRREREEMIRAHQPSKSSPMIDPDQPSTVPVPAAEEQISDHPLKRRAEELTSPHQDHSQPLETPSSHDHLLDLPSSDSSADLQDSLKKIEPSSVLLPSWDVSQQVATEEAHSSNSRQQQSDHLESEKSFGRHIDEADESEVVTLNTKPLAGLYAEKGPMRKFFFMITVSPSIVGRNPQNTCPLPPDGPRSDRQISREHFELLSVDQDRWEIRCLSTQGVQVNDTQLKAGDTALLRDKTLILIGETALRFRCSTHWRAQLVKNHLMQT